MSIRRADLAPLWHAFGAAVFEGQHLEHGLQLLLKLIDHDLTAKGKSRVRLNIDSPQAHQKMGDIFDEVQLFRHFTDAERKIVQKGLKTRNFLVHAYWQGNRVVEMSTSDGRAGAVAELDRLREQCRKAGRLVDSFVDEQLSKAGTSLRELSASVEDRWQNDPRMH